MITLSLALQQFLHTAKQATGSRYIRVAKVVTVHDDLLTQRRPIKMSKFRANIFLVRITSNYLWASEVSKNQSF